MTVMKGLQLMFHTTLKGVVDTHQEELLMHTHDTIHPLYGNLFF